MEDNERLKIISESARLFRDTFASKNYLIVLKSKNAFEAIEIDASKNNFLHLTGVQTNANAEVFFDRAIDGKLSSQDFTLRDSGETDKKLSVIEKAMNFIGGVKNGGKFSPRNSQNLITDMIIGNDEFALGFIKDTNSQGHTYVPNTLLKGKADNYIANPKHMIYAVFVKDKKDQEYKDLTYISKQGKNDGLSKDSWNVEKLASLRISKKIISRITGANKPPKQNNSETVDENTREKDNDKMNVAELKTHKKIIDEATQASEKILEEKRKAEKDRRVQQVQPLASTQHAEKPIQNGGGNNHNQEKPKPNRNQNINTRR